MSADRRPSRRAVWVALALLLLTACGGPDPTWRPGQTLPAAAEPSLPATVAGMTGCGGLVQRPTAERVLPDLVLPCLTERSGVNPARLAGRPTVINLWATWCQPCRQEMPMLQAAHRRTAPRVQFLGVDTKDRADWAAEFLAEVKVTYPQVVDSDGQLLAALRSPGLPVTVVLDRRGRITGRQVGRITEAQLTALIDAAVRG